jgi:Tol biopolymer transport system component
MRDDSDTTSTHKSSDRMDDRLDSWKEIAAYLGRGIRTVQRWEREEGLPVHRLAHEKRGSIYARREELAAWWESRRLTLASSTAEPAGVAAPRLERVTRSSAMTNWPALSSDARLIAYVSDSGQDGSTPQIWLQQIGGTAIRLTDREHAYSHLSFSPDDTRIVFTATDASGPNVYEVPTLGGDARLLQRGASRGAISADGRWLVSVARDAAGIRIAARDGAGFRTVAADLVDVACLAWSPDSRCVVVHARSDPRLETDWWVVPIDGTPPVNTSVVRNFREARMFTVPTGVAWADDSLLFSAAGAQGVCLYRQRIEPSTFKPAGAPQQLTDGSDSAWLPTSAAGRLAFLNSHADANLWSVAVDPASGIAHGPLRRITRGPGILSYLSVTSDFRTLSYFSVRLGKGGVFVRDLETDAERMVEDGPPDDKWDPTISASGTQLAYGVRTPAGEQALRPIFITSLRDGTWRRLGEDCGGRPREWVNERSLVIQRFTRPNSIAVIDTETGMSIELLKSRERSVTNPRLSPDRRWIAFDAAQPGQPPGVFVSPFREESIPESEWVAVEQAATHPFWSADGRLLYFTPLGTNPLVRTALRARRFSSAHSPADGESIAVYALSELVMPAYLSGTAPVATPDQILLVLGDFRGDVWLMDLEPHS